MKVLLQTREQRFRLVFVPDITMGKREIVVNDKIAAGLSEPSVGFRSFVLVCFGVYSDEEMCEALDDFNSISNALAT